MISGLLLLSMSRVGTGKESISGNDSSVSSTEEQLVIIGVASSVTIGELLETAVRATGGAKEESLRGETVELLLIPRLLTDPQGRTRVAARY